MPWLEISGKEGSVKPLRFKRKLKFYRYKRPSFVMGKSSRLLQYFISLLVAAGEVVRSWDHGDSAQAVRNLDKTLKEINANVCVKRRQKIVVLIIEHRHGRNVHLCESQDVAIDQLYAFVEEYWNEIPEDVGLIPMNQQEAIEIYFHEKLGRESYEILTLPVQHTTTL